MPAPNDPRNRLFNSDMAAPGINRLLAVAITSLLLITPLSAQEERVLFQPALIPVSGSETTESFISAISAISDTELETGDSSPSTPATNNVLSTIETINQYRQSLEEIAIAEGPYSYSLSEQHLALALELQSLNEHSSALEEIDKAAHIIRINEGLFTPSQLNHIQYKMQSLQALGDEESLDNLRSYLFYVQQKNFPVTSPEFVEASKVWTRWYLREFLEEPYPGSLDVDDKLANPASEARALSTFYGSSDPYSMSNTPGTVNSIAQQMQFQMQREIELRLKTLTTLYSTIFNELEPLDDANTELSIDDIRLQQSYYREFTNTSFAVNVHLNLMETALSQYRRGSGHIYNSRNPSSIISREYRQGRNSLEKILNAFLANSHAGTADVLGAYLDLADWHLAFDHSRLAFELYADAYQYLSDQGLSEIKISELMSLPVSTNIPTFITHYYSPQLWQIYDEPDLEFTAYYDIAFNRDKYGNMTDLNILSSSPDASGEARKMLLDHLRFMKQRPKFEQGIPVEENNLQVRYFYTFH